MQGSILTWHWFLAQSHHQVESQLHAPRLISYDTEDGTSNNVAILFDTTTMGATYIVGVYFLVIMSYPLQVLCTHPNSPRPSPCDHS